MLNYTFRSVDALSNCCNSNVTQILNPNGSSQMVCLNCLAKRLEGGQK